MRPQHRERVVVARAEDPFDVECAEEWQGGVSIWCVQIPFLVSLRTEHLIKQRLSMQSSDDDLLHRIRLYRNYCGWLGRMPSVG